jgi:hypothetical protein
VTPFDAGSIFLRSWIAPLAALSRSWSVSVFFSAGGTSSMNAFV